MTDVYYAPDAVTQDGLFAQVDNVKADRTPEDLLFQTMLDLGILLSSSIVVEEVAGRRVFNVADGFLLACFDRDVTDEVVTAIAQRRPYYAVFRDASMADDSALTNFDQLFAAYSPATVRQVICPSLPRAARGRGTACGGRGAMADQSASIVRSRYYATGAPIVTPTACHFPRRDGGS